MKDVMIDCKLIVLGRFGCVGGVDALLREWVTLKPQKC